MNEKKYNVIYIKFSKYSKIYTYLIDDEIEIGDYVYVDGKENKYEVIEKDILNESELPVPVNEMKYARKCMIFEEKLNDLLKNNNVLRVVEGDVNLIGRDDVIEDLIVTINKKRMKNAILIGDAGCGKTTIVEALAKKINDKYIILSFSAGELIGGTELRGMLEKRLCKIFNDVIEFNKNNEKKIIIFIDEIHMLVTNTDSQGWNSVHDMMKTYLTNNNVIVIGATTINEFNRYIKKDLAFVRRMTPIYVDVLADDVVLDILVQFSNKNVSKKLLKEIIKKSKEIVGATNPDISIEILDRIITKHEILGCNIDSNIINKEIDKLKSSYMA